LLSLRGTARWACATSPALEERDCLYPDRAAFAMPRARCLAPTHVVD
jgi:hypothetical protein